MTIANLYWSDWHNAEIYNIYVQEYPIYQELNRHLIELARINTARRVLDLASGSGATARSCLSHLPEDSQLVGVDASEAMISLARMEIDDPRASFEVSTAETADVAVSGTFDRIVCNAAFWQLGTPYVLLQNLANLLDPGGLFVFNVPAELVVGESSDVHALQIALARAIESEVGRSFALNPQIIEPGRLAERLDEVGFELVAQERFVYRGLQKELLELMRIPVMIAPLTPGLSPETRQSVLDVAGERTDPEQRVEVPWIYFVARMRPGRSNTKERTRTTAQGASQYEAPLYAA